jgi:hypothetical protein
MRCDISPRSRALTGTERLQLHRQKPSTQLEDELEYDGGPRNVISESFRY